MNKCRHEGCIVKTDSKSGYCTTHLSQHRDEPAAIPDSPPTAEEILEEIIEPSVAVIPVVQELAADEQQAMVAIDERPASRAELRLVAVQPSEMERAQKDLVAWAQRRLDEENVKCDELMQNYELAIKNKWRSGPFKNALNVSAKRVKSFEKILAALQQGYVIIPDFPVTVIAIRTGRELPVSNYRANDSGYVPYQPDQKAQNLTAGEGNYVSPRPEVSAQTQRWTEPTGQNKTHTWSRAKAFADVDFPFILAKPAVLDATARAMTDKIFDEIGIAPQQSTYQKVSHQQSGGFKQDPMIIGRIHVPVGVGRKRTLSFMIAWFLDEKMLP